MAYIRTFITACILAVALHLQGMTLKEAREAYRLGDFEQAAPTLAEEASRNPKNMKLNEMAGIALYHSGQEEEAMPYLRRGTSASNLYMAQIAMHRYNFDQASDYLDRYEKGFKRSRKAAATERPETTRVRNDIERGRSMLERVEQTIIIDSIDVDRDEFFKAYRLSAPSGTLRSPADLPRQFEAADPTVIYTTENADEIFWAMPDSKEDFRLATSSLLADNTWERASMLPALLNEGGDANYPFMMSDGVTLYYANTGENSLGGYDIFISRRDGDTWYQPQNIGMPYNSYANDYMMAIDEITGVGWWATDRNAAPDRLTIYVFVPADLRVNYPTDHEHLAERALITDYRATWPEGSDYSAQLNAIAHLHGGGEHDGSDFRFAIPTRGVYTSLDQFQRPKAREMMKEHLKLVHEYDLYRRKLAVMRASYASGKKTLANDILALESDVERLRAQLLLSSNRIVAEELRQ